MSLCAAASSSSSASRRSFPELRFSRHSRAVRKSQHLGTEFRQGKALLVGHYCKQSYRQYHYQGGKLQQHARAFLDDGIECDGNVDAIISPDKHCLDQDQDHQVGAGASTASTSSNNRVAATGTTTKELVDPCCSGSSDHREAGRDTKELAIEAENGVSDASSRWSCSDLEEVIEGEIDPATVATEDDAELNLPQVFQLLSAWDSLSERLSPEILHCHGSQLLLSALKVAVPAFQIEPYSRDGRFLLSRALSIAFALADLHMDAEVIASGILRVAMETEALSLTDVQRELGAATFHLLDDSLRVNQLVCRLDTLGDDASVAMLRDFTLTYHDVRAMVVEIASRLDEMRHLDSLPRLRQQIAALENMQLYAPLAHALGLGTISQELDDMAFRILFPDSYQCVEDWLHRHWGNGDSIISDSIRRLNSALETDDVLQGMIESVKVTGRRKSRFSTMKKLLRDGRAPEQVYDILGLRVIVLPKIDAGDGVGIDACYRVQKVANRIWKEVPGRTKDYIAKPKKNGYSSLHLAVHLSDYGPWSLPMEIQIRTSAMHSDAVSGASSHALYKGGLTDPRQVENFKTIMLAAAKAAACRFSSDAIPEPDSDQVFRMFDKNGDGIISSEEFHDVLQQLRVDRSDTYELMKLLDTNTDGSVDPKEFAQLKKQVRSSIEDTRLRSQIRKSNDFSKRLQHSIQLSVF